MFLPVIVSTAWLPRLVSAAERGPQALREAARAPLELVLVLSLPIAALTAVVAEPAIAVLYGSAYEEAAPVLVVLGLCLPPLYLNIMLSQVLVAQGRQVQWTWVMAGATVVNPALNAALISLTDARYGNGAVGAALSLLVTEVLIVTVGFFVVGSTLLNGAALKRCLRAAVASFGGWAAAYLTSPAGPLVSIPAAAVVIAVAALALRVASPAQVAVVKNLVRRHRRAGV
jgi:O-antigen/teichoic acid export membrane protein